MENPRFFKTVWRLALPVALQSMLQASFCVVDQMMIGQLGTVSVAGVGLAGKFSSIFSVIVSAVGAVAGILVAQYLGQKNTHGVRKSFFVNLWLSLILAGMFTALGALLPAQVMGLYSHDAETVRSAAGYLRIVSFTFFPIAGATMTATLLRCAEKAALPLYASVTAAVVNTGLNYLLIFGKAGFPALGAQGAALATVAAQIVNFLLMVVFLLHSRKLLHAEGGAKTPFLWGQYAVMLLPVLACEFLWSLGENVYAVIYGNMGTDAAAAMTLMNPVQAMAIGALSGLSQAAGILIGKRLGAGEDAAAYGEAKRLLRYGLIGAVGLSCLIVLGSGWYVKIYRVEPEVKALTQQLLLAYALIMPVKVEDMILGSGVLRSGGRTQYVMAIDMTGTWLFGVPLGLLAAFVWRLPLPWTYFLLSMEECVRLVLSLVVFRGRRWMHRLDG